MCFEYRKRLVFDISSLQKRDEVSIASSLANLLSFARLTLKVHRDRLSCPCSLFLKMMICLDLVVGFGL